MILKAVVFDCDGVILDSFREGMRRIKVVAAMNDVPYGREARARLIEKWGLPGVELLMEGLQINKELAKRLYTQWEKLDLASIPPLVPGTREVLFWLRKNGFKSCMLTSRLRPQVMALLDRLDLEREFTVITTRDDNLYHKPDPRTFFHTLSTLDREHGILKEHCVFLGDTPSDIVAGQGVGVRTLVAQTGPYLLKHAALHPLPLSDILQSIDNLPLWVEENHEGKIEFMYD